MDQKWSTICVNRPAEDSSLSLSCVMCFQIISKEVSFSPLILDLHCIPDSWHAIIILDRQKLVLKCELLFA